MPASQSTSALQGSSKRDRRPDWHEFYKNGPPKEIIVIDDDTPPSEPGRKENSRAAAAVKPTVTRGEPTNKKRRTAYDAARDQQEYSYARTYSDNSGGSNTISTDRTTSLQTTAPTSMGSSHGSAGAYVDESQVGQKRKRVTRGQIANEKKRAMQGGVDSTGTQGDAFSAYVPPPKPPIKAKEVHVPSVKDVSLS